MDVSSLDVSQIGLTAGPDNSGSDTSGILSGLGDLFAGIGSAVGSGLAASNLHQLPTASSGWAYNPATGQYYNPVTGQALTATGTLPSAASFFGGGSSNFLIIALLAVLAFFLFKRRE